MSEAPARQDESLIGEVLASRYRIVERLGEGAMGTVYKARHVKVGRSFAVKVLHRELLEDRKFTQRFEREAELAGRLSHPNVAGVVDVGETPAGSRYMVMEFAEGRDLATLLEAGPMHGTRIIHLTRQLLEGLYHAHEEGLIHRDFKPENIIIERDDHDTEVPRIVDFGIAILREGGDSVNAAGRVTTNGLVLGTPHYMAPEQAVADPLDHRIDLFALGIVVYEMLCARLPFDGTGAEVARANLLLDPPAIAQRAPGLVVDPLLEAFARRLMAKKRDQRPATAKVARELLDLIAGDRAAAAIALGVATLPRAPSITQPPAVVRAEPEDEPVVPQAPIAVPASPVATTDREVDVSTMMAEPLVWGGRRRRSFLFGGIAVCMLLAITIVVIATRHDDLVRDDRRVATITPDASVVVPVTEPVKPVTEPVTERETESKTESEIDGGVEEPVITPPVTPPRNPPRKPTPPKLDPQHDGSAATVVKPPEVAKPPEIPIKPPDPPIKPDRPIKPIRPASPANTADSVQALYLSVGTDIRLARQARGEAAIEKLAEKYRLIQIQTDNSDAKRDATARLLNAMRAELAPLKSRP